MLVPPSHQCPVPSPPGVTGCQCSACEHQDVLAGTGHPSATSGIWKCCSRESRECCVHTTAEEPGLGQSLEQLSCSTSLACREPQNWCQTPETSSLCCRDVPPQAGDTPESQGLPGQEVALIGRTLGHQGTGLEPPPHSTRAPEEPSASTDCPSLTWARLKPGTETPHNPWPTLFPPPLCRSALSDACLSQP